MAFSNTFQDLYGMEQLPGLASQHLMAQGYGYGGEGDWKVAAMTAIMKAMSAGPDRRHRLYGGLYLPPGARPGVSAWAPTCWRCAPRVAAAAAPHRGASPGHRRPRSPRPGWCSRATRAPAIVVSLIDMGGRLRLICQDIAVRQAHHGHAQPARGPGDVAARMPDLTTGVDVLDHGRRRPPHGAQLRRHRRA